MSGAPVPPPPPMDGPAIIAMVKRLDGNFEARAEVWNHQTRVIRTKYIMLLDKGFNEAQALDLCYRDWSAF